MRRAASVVASIVPECRHFPHRPRRRVRGSSGRRVRVSCSILPAVSVVIGGSPKTQARCRGPFRACIISVSSAWRRLLLCRWSGILRSANGVGANTPTPTSTRKTLPTNRSSIARVPRSGTGPSGLLKTLTGTSLGSSSGSAVRSVAGRRAARAAMRQAARGRPYRRGRRPGGPRCSPLASAPPETRPCAEHEGVEGRASPSPMITIIRRRRRAGSRTPCCDSVLALGKENACEGHPGPSRVPDQAPVTSPPR